MGAPKGNKFAKGNKGGRPTTYHESFCKALISFFKRDPYTILKDNNRRPVLNKFGQPIMIPTNFPTIEGFAVSIGIHKDTVYEWVDKHKEFSDAFTRAKDHQKEILIINGLNGNYNSKFAQFVATNCTDMVEKHTVEHSGQIEINDDQYARIIAREASSLNKGGE